MKAGIPLLLILLMVGPYPTTQAQEPLLPFFGGRAKTSVLPNLDSSTLGGLQFWSDELVQRGWRIQRNAITGHYRLLDDANVRVAWGSFEQCQQRWNEIRRERNLEPVRGKVVILLHGLGATRFAMEGLGKYLETEGGYSMVNVTYASTRADLATHASSLAKVIDGLNDAEEIYFVGHSLGNLVIRQYMTDLEKPGQPRKLDPRIRRFVMLGPPNNGAQMGAKLKDLSFFEPVVGKSATQVSSSPEEISRIVATPACEFAIIAGGQGNGEGLNPLIAGDDDLVIGVDETKLSGARDFVVVQVLHRKLMNDAKVRESTLRFLQQGFFVSEAARRPLP